MCYCYTFMVAVNPPIKFKEQSSHRILATNLQITKHLAVATAWLRCFLHLSAVWQTATNCKSVSSHISSSHSQQTSRRRCVNIHLHCPLPVPMSCDLMLHVDKWNIFFKITQCLSVRGVSAWNSAVSWPFMAFQPKQWRLEVCSEAVCALSLSAANPALF